MHRQSELGNWRKVKEDEGDRQRRKVKEDEGDRSVLTLWTFGFLALVVSIPALIIAAIAFAKMPGATCPTFAQQVLTLLIVGCADICGSPQILPCVR